MAFVDIGLDLQILICTLLHPTNILTLRKTCKTLQLVTRQRTIWVDALRRVCFENTLFLPSFPILDMSDVELEQAAIAPRRWIELSTSFVARELSDTKVRLPPTATRVIDTPFPNDHTTSLFLVPGGRYMVAFSAKELGVWDLGYTSSADCKLIASVEPEGGAFSGKVHATPDGMGLVVIPSLRPYKHCSVYEIYPESENPRLIKIACLDSLPGHNPRGYVSPGKIIWVAHHRQERIVRVWDYRLNASVSFSVLVDAAYFRYDTKVVATETAIIILCEEDIFIWAIPPLLPEPPDFDDYSLTQFPPVIRAKIPDGLGLYPPLATWRIMSSWYFDPSKPLYVDKVYPGHSRLQRFKIIIEPDFKAATLHLINNIRLTTSDFERETPSESMFCEDTLVYTWSAYDQCGIYTGSTLSRPTLHGDSSMTTISLPVDKPGELRICPASGRLVYLHTGGDTNKIEVFDFLPYHQKF